MEFDPSLEADSENYWNFSGLKEVLIFYKEYYFESKINDIKLIEEDLLYNKKGNYYKYLKDYDIAKEMNKRTPIIKYLYNSKIEEEKIKTEEDFIEEVKLWEILEKMIKKKQIKKIKKIYPQILNRLIDYFSYKNNKEILLKVFNKDIYEYFKNSNFIFLKEVLMYYRDYKFESKKKDIIIIEEIIKNKKDDYKKYLSDYEIAEKMNLRTPIIKYLYKLLNREKLKTEKELFIVGELLHGNIKRIIVDKKLKKIAKSYCFLLNEFFNDDNNKELLLNIFDQESYNYFIEYNYFSDKLKKIKTVLIYYKDFLFESKIKDIILIEDIIKNNNKEEYEKYLYDYNIAKEMNLRTPIIEYLFNNINNGIKKTEEEFKKVVNIWKEIELMIKNNEIEKISKEIKKILIEYFKIEKNKEILLKIFSLDEYEYISNEINNEIIQQNEKDKNFIIISKKNNIKKILSEENDPESILRLDLYDDSKIIEYTIYNILNKSSIIIHTNERGKEPYFIFDDISYGKYNVDISYSRYKELIDIYYIKEEIKENYKKYFDYLKEIENIIKREFKYSYNLIIKLEFKRENKINYNSIYNITCFLSFYEPIHNEQMIFKEENILINRTDSNSNGFKSFINEINNKTFENIKYKEFNSNIQIK